jgi:hypothetical protein
MRFEGKLTQFIFLILLAVSLYLTGPWIIDTLGEIFKTVGDRHLENIENYDPTNVE